MNAVTIALLFGSFIGLMLLRVPLAFALAGSAALAIFQQGLSDTIILQQFYSGTESWVLMAIPFFILTGSIMERGEMSERLVQFVDRTVGFLPGGMGNVNVGGSMLFGGISGSAAADTSALGSILIPAMERSGYSRAYAAALTSASSPIGMILPPSIPMVIWGFVAGMSVGDLFLGGVLPGLLIGALLMVTSLVIARRRGYETTTRKFSARKLLSSLPDGLVAAGAPAIIIGGIITGIFTPTEAGVIAVAYALVAVILRYRKFGPRKLALALLDAGKMSASIMFLLAGASLFSYVLARNRIPQLLSDAMLAFADSPGLFILTASALLFVVAMFLDVTVTILLLGPVLAPLAVELGADPLQTALIFMVVLATGLITPPLALCLFVASTVSGESVERISREIVPFVCVLLGVAALIWFLPGLATWLPGLAGG
jgi:C4-dicarboxylate transporter DctM subunit